MMEVSIGPQMLSYEECGGKSMKGVLTKKVFSEYESAKKI
jgi:hypothetical protein